jgi:E3 ubiquitin-protein ligase HECTD2
MAPLTPRLKTQQEPLNTNDGSPARTCSQSRITEADLELAYGIPALHASPDMPSTSNLHIRPTSKHGRSMSHPFPVLFHSKQKRQGVNALSTAEVSDGNNHALPSQNQSRTATSKPAKPSEKLLVTGKCMTCDSTVRWPKELSVFRCTVCLTINDLKAASTAMLERDTQGINPFGEMSTYVPSASFSRSILSFTFHKSAMSNMRR